MNITTEEWARISALRGAELKSRVFSIIQQASSALQSDEYDAYETLEVVPRLAEIIPSHPELKSYREPFSALARACGLWNYIDKEAASEPDLLLAEAVTVPELDGVTLHREQVEALNELLSGRNLILSAPTSFGKSLLVDALLASRKYKRVAIVLPTIALLDEFRRRIRRRFRDTFKIVMHHSDVVDPHTPTIFLGTQERLIHRDDLGTLDLTVVDEFYKLDPSRRDDRSITLNAAVYKLLNRSQQFFFLGPNIDGVRFAEGGKWKFEFLKTRFSTVAVDTYDLRGAVNKEEQLLNEIERDENWPALVFISSPDRANRIATQAAKAMAVSDTSASFAQWLSENVGPKWSLVRTVNFGFGVHHGRLPRAMASHMVRLFNDGVLPVMFCTSTLIEGVNTVAKTILIFDKNINKAPYDFFTYSNIKGRAGRLGEHHVGKVFIFNDAPEHEVMEVAPTLFGDEDSAPDAYVVHLDSEKPRKSIDARISALKTSLELDAHGLRLAASVGLESAFQLKDLVAKALKNRAPLLWSGYPKYNEISHIVQLICGVRKPLEFGAFTPSSLTFLINSLRKAESMKAFLNRHDDKYVGSEDGYDNIFRFLRSCEYGLPQWFSLIESFVRLSRPEVDYSLFIQGLSCWFKPEILKELDEEGIPIQISERFFCVGDSKMDLISKLSRLCLNNSPELTKFEREWVIAALELY